MRAAVEDAQRRLLADRLEVLAGERDHLALADGEHRLAAGLVGEEQVGQRELQDGPVRVAPLGAPDQADPAAEMLAPDGRFAAGRVLELRLLVGYELELARELGGRVPGRLVTSAKSWLSHGAVDRGASILPWGALEGVARISPVEASAS